MFRKRSLVIPHLRRQHDLIMFIGFHVRGRPQDAETHPPSTRSEIAIRFPRQPTCTQHAHSGHYSSRPETRSTVFSDRVFHERTQSPVTSLPSSLVHEDDVRVCHEASKLTRIDLGERWVQGQVRGTKNGQKESLFGIGQFSLAKWLWSTNGT